MRLRAASCALKHGAALIHTARLLARATFSTRHQSAIREPMTIARKITENYIATEVGDEVVLIDMAGGELMSLKGTARAIWHAIDGESSLEHIACSMADQFEITPDAALVDIRELASEFERANLLELCD